MATSMFDLNVYVPNRSAQGTEWLSRLRLLACRFVVTADGERLANKGGQADGADGGQRPSVEGALEDYIGGGLCDSRQCSEAAADWRPV